VAWCAWAGRHGAESLAAVVLLPGACDLRIVRPHAPLDLRLGVHVPKFDQLRRGLRFRVGWCCRRRLAWFDKRIPRNRRRYRMPVAARYRMGLVEPVLHGLAALAAHGGVKLRGVT